MEIEMENWCIRCERPNQCHKCKIYEIMKNRTKED